MNRSALTTEQTLPEATHPSGDTCVETQPVEPLFHYALLQQQVNLQTAYEQQGSVLRTYKTEAHYWKALHKKAVAREQEQRQTHARIVEKLDAKIRKLNKMLFGKKSEKGTNKQESNPNDMTNGAAKNNAEPKKRAPLQNLWVISAPVACQ